MFDLTIRNNRGLIVNTYEEDLYEFQGSIRKLA